MRYYKNAADAFHTIMNSSDFEDTTNQFCIWQVNEQFIIEKRPNNKEDWKLFTNQSVVRALRILSINNLIFASNYKILVGENFLKIETDPTVLENLYSSKSEYYNILNKVHKIQQLLFCDVKKELNKSKESPSFQVYIYPDQILNGLFLELGTSYIYLLKEISEFAKTNSIKIHFGEDEEKLFRCPVVKSKLTWEDYFLSYHIGICYIIHEEYRNMKEKSGYIKKVPEVSCDDSRLIVLNNMDKKYLHLGLEDWKIAVVNYEKEKLEWANFYAEENKSLKKSNGEWESIYDNPYYNSDNEMDEQSQEFWDSI